MGNFHNNQDLANAIIEQAVQTILERFTAHLGENQVQRNKVLTVDGCAEFYGISPAMVRKLVAQNEIPFFRIGQCVRFHVHEIEKWNGTMATNDLNVLRSASFKRKKNHF